MFVKGFGRGISLLPLLRSVLPLADLLAGEMAPGRCRH